MYSKQEAAQLRAAFWTALGQYLSPILSAEGEKINWINYKTGEKPVAFRMEAGDTGAGIAIVITHKDPAIRKLYFGQFLSLRQLLHESVGELWAWDEEAADENGRPLARIGTSISGVGIYRREDWPALISFFKPRILALDAFWSNAKYGFETLRAS